MSPTISGCIDVCLGGGGRDSSEHITCHGVQVTTRGGKSLVHCH
jgi:hypothetical protein